MTRALKILSDHYLFSVYLVMSKGVAKGWGSRNNVGGWMTIKVGGEEEVGPSFLRDKTRLISVFLNEERKEISKLCNMNQKPEMIGRKYLHNLETGLSTTLISRNIPMISVQVVSKA